MASKSQSKTNQNPTREWFFLFLDHLLILQAKAKAVHFSSEHWGEGYHGVRVPEWTPSARVRTVRLFTSNDSRLSTSYDSSRRMRLSLNGVKIPVQNKPKPNTWAVFSFFGSPLLILQAKAKAVRDERTVIRDEHGQDWIGLDQDWSQFWPDRTWSDCIFFKLADQDWIRLRKFLLF